MSSEILIILTAMGVMFVAAVFIIQKHIPGIEQKPSKELLELIHAIQTNSSEDKRMLLETLSTSSKDLNTRLDKTAHIITALNQSVGEMSEIGRGIQNIQQYLTSPKLRGGIGEQLLKELLADVLPQDCYKIQYTFSNGKIADAVIKTSNGLIPIDAKFPLDSFRKYTTAQIESEQKQFYAQFLRDVNKHINDIAEKYHAFSDKTTDYAIMYVPSETIYYEIIRSNKIYESALEHMVLIVSPVTFYAYLQAIIASMQGQRIQSQAKQLLTLLKTISHDYEHSEKQLNLLNKHLSNAYSAATVFTSGYGRLKEKLLTTKTFQLPNKTSP